MDFDSFKKKYQKAPVEEFPNNVSLTPVVSIIVVTYQHAPYIRQCLDGILMQEVDFEYEILLGDDESTDGTREICIEYAERHPDKIRLFLHSRENNIKIAGRPTGRFNFIYNLFSARGKYIALCEGDDYWIDHTKIAMQVEFFENNREFILHGYDAFVEGDENRKYIFGNSEDQMIDSNRIVLKNRFATLTVMFRVSHLKINGWFLVLPFGDWCLYYHLLEKGYGYLSSNKIAVYRFHNNGAWSSIKYNRREVNRRIIRHLSMHLIRTNNIYNKYKVAVEIMRRLG